MREQLLDLLRRRPFAPFRVYLADGRVFDIVHPHLNIAGLTLFTIGVPDSDAPESYAEYFIDVDYPQIHRVEMLPATTAAAP
jgi:hypothetical protein